MTLHSIFIFINQSQCNPPGWNGRSLYFIFFINPRLEKSFVAFFFYKPKVIVIRKVILFNTNTMQIFLNSTNIDKGNNYPTPKFQKTLFSIPFYH